FRRRPLEESEPAAPLILKKLLNRFLNDPGERYVVSVSYLLQRRFLRHRDRDRESQFLLFAFGHDPPLAPRWCMLRQNGSHYTNIHPRAENGYAKLFGAGFCPVQFLRWASLSELNEGTTEY